MPQQAANPCRTQYSNQLLHAIHQHLPIRGLPLTSDDQRKRWTPRVLATCAILMTWCNANSLRDAFAAAHDGVVAMYPTRKRPGKHLEGFLKALQSQSADLLNVILPSLRASTKRLAAKRWRWNDWLILGVDGSRVNCPRTKSNEKSLGRAGHERTGPQLQLTTLFHMATGLPWAWRSSAGRTSERVHLAEMLPDLPRKTLLIADAGFTGYDLFNELLTGGHAFIVRVGRNVSLIKNLGYDVECNGEVVYLWPKTRQSEEPLTLRLITIKRAGKVMSLLTNLDHEQLSQSAALQLYRQRWELEVMFRSLKQTLGKRKL